MPEGVQGPLPPLLLLSCHSGSLRLRLVLSLCCECLFLYMNFFLNICLLSVPFFCPFPFPFCTGAQRRSSVREAQFFAFFFSLLLLRRVG